MKHHRIMAGLAVLAATAVLAHPHASVDQQAHLTVGRTTAKVTYYIAPSSLDGGHMFDHVDSDGNGRLSAGERRVFAAALLDATKFQVDGRPAALVVSHSAFPSRSTLSRGEGTIGIQAEAPVRLSAGQSHALSFRVRYHAFAPRWHIQPFLSGELKNVPLRIARPTSGDKVVVAF